MRLSFARRSAILAIVCAASASAQRPLAYTRVTLPNGFTALLNEDHSAPLVAVQLWYHIGSKNDTPGRAGAAHLCEHAQGLGTPQIDQPMRAFYPSIGGTSPHVAQTTEDVTEYNVIVPPNQLETVLWLEGGRMAAPLSRLTDQALAGLRSVIGQERSQNIENFPFGVSREIVTATLYPAGNPYHMTPNPPLADLYGASAADLRAACLPYYVPNNAVMALSGDFDSRAVRGWVTKYFGSIKRGAAPPKITVPPVTATGERRLVVEDQRANQPRLQFDWIGASYTNRDRIPLLALASSLSLNRFGPGTPPLGRLSKLLVVDRQLATNVIADNTDLERGGIFEILVFPRPGASLTTIETLVDSVLADLATHPITAAELQRFQNYNDVDGTTSLQTKFARADTLVHDQIFAGDPLAHAKQAADAHRLTRRDLQRVAAKYLTKDRIVMSLVPAGKLNLVSKPELPYVNVTPAMSGAGARP